MNKDNVQHKHTEAGRDRAQTARHGAATKALSVILSVLLALTPSNTAVSAAMAEQLIEGSGPKSSAEVVAEANDEAGQDAADTSTTEGDRTSAEEGTGTVADGSDASEEGHAASDAAQADDADAPVADTAEEAGTRTLESTITAADGHTYTVTLTYGADAQIPDGAELEVAQVVEEPEDYEEQKETTYKGRPTDAERFEAAGELRKEEAALREGAGLAASDELVGVSWLDVRIVAGGERVAPQAPVTIAVATDAAAAAESDALRLAVRTASGWRGLDTANRTAPRGGAEEEEIAAEGEDAWDVGVSARTAASARDMARAAEDGEEASDPVDFDRVALATVASRKLYWRVGGAAVAVYGPAAARLRTARAGLPEVSEGRRVLSSFTADVEGAPAWGARLWVTSTASARADGSGLLGWQVEGGEKVRDLFGAAGTDAPEALSAGDGLALVWQEGERSAGDDADADADADADGPSEDGAGDADTPEITAGQVLAASDGRTYDVSVTYGAGAGVPDGAALVVRELTGAEYDDYAARTAEARGDEPGYLRAFDISLFDADGNEVEPKGEVDVAIALADADAESASDLKVVHFAGGDEEPEVLDAEVSEADPEADDGGAGALADAATVTFTTDSFSVYTVSYTVDFHWGEYTYNLAGGHEMYLSELLRALGTSNASAEATEGETQRLAALSEDMGRVQDVTFSDPDLLRVEKRASEQAQDDWLLTSLQAFDTEETLTVTLADGSELVVRVTDEAEENENAIARVSNDGGTTWKEFEWLVNADKDEDGTLLGAFNYANTLKGDVIIELTRQTHERYTLASGFTFGTNANSASIDTLKIRTKDGVERSTITKAQTSKPMIIFNNRGCAVTVENLILEGDSQATNANGSGFRFETNSAYSGKYLSGTFRNTEFRNLYATGGSTSGGAIYNSNDKVKLTVDNCTFTNCRANDHGGAIYASSTLKLIGSEFNNCQAALRAASDLKGGAVRARVFDT